MDWQFWQALPRGWTGMFQDGIGHNSNRWSQLPDTVTFIVDAALLVGLSFATMIGVSGKLASSRGK
jgi:hypothetical protein